jgi:hypothetical protein
MLRNIERFPIIPSTWPRFVKVHKKIHVEFKERLLAGEVADSEVFAGDSTSHGFDDP